MTNLRLLAIAALIPLAACASAPAIAQAQVDVAAFDAIDLRGGGHVTVRHGVRQRVTLLRGDLATSRIEVGSRRGNERSLVIEACRTSCSDYDLRVEIVTPDIGAVAVTGGGEIEFESGFAAQRALALSVTGGGSIDARAVPAQDVAASVRGGGSIQTEPRNALAASVSGGGAIVYSGNPMVTSSVQGGGAVTRGRSR